MRKLLKIWFCSAVVLLLTGCGSKGSAEGKEGATQEDREAKRLLQGVWADEETEEVSFWAKGDTIFYADSVSQPTRFAIIGNELVLDATDVRYHIEKQTEHTFWFRNQNNDVVRLVKSSTTLPDEFVQGDTPSVLTYTEVVKQDSVVMYSGERYHWYIAINPTKYKVHRTAYNEDGVEVDNVYYDNIMHVSVFKGSQKVFSHDFRKQDYQQKVPKEFLGQSVLGNMEFAGIDGRGLRFVATVCIPDGATCYKAEHLVSFDGKLSTSLIEY